MVAVVAMVACHLTATELLAPSVPTAGANSNSLAAE